MAAARGFEISLGGDELDSIAPELMRQAKKDVEQAINRALRRSAQWIRTHSLRELGKELGVKQTPIKRRFNVYPRIQDGQVKVWVGLRPISVHWLGNPKRAGDGVDVRGHHYANAFINPMTSRYPLVWRRSTSARLPLERVVQEWGDKALDVINRYELRVNARFREIFEQELNYARIKNAG